MQTRPTSSRPIATEPPAETFRPLRWLGLAVLSVAALAWWAGRDEPTDPTALPRAYASPLGPPPELPAAVPTVAHPVQVVTPVAAPAPACTGTNVELLLEGRSQAQCIGPAVALQTGSLRSHRAEAAGGGRRWVQVDTAGDELVGVAVGRGSLTEYACEAPACTGVTVGALDRHGQREIALLAVPLIRQPGAPDDVVDPDTLLTGRLASTLPRAGADEACAAPSLWVDQSAKAASLPFCAQDGVAVEHGDDGGRIHRFAGLDSPPIAVTTGADGALLRIEFDTLACSGAQCAGAVLSASESPGPLDLSLNGTVLLPTDARTGWARLSGRLTSP